MSDNNDDHVGEYRGRESMFVVPEGMVLVPVVEARNHTRIIVYPQKKYVDASKGEDNATKKR